MMSFKTSSYVGVSSMSNERYLLTETYNIMQPNNLDANYLWHLDIDLHAKLCCTKQCTANCTDMGL